MNYEKALAMIRRALDIVSSTKAWGMEFYLMESVVPKHLHTASFWISTLKAHLDLGEQTNCKCISLEQHYPSRRSLGINLHLMLQRDAEAHTSALNLGGRVRPDTEALTNFVEKCVISFQCSIQDAASKLACQSTSEHFCSRSRNREAHRPDSQSEVQPKPMV